MTARNPSVGIGVNAIACAVIDRAYNYPIAIGGVACGLQPGQATYFGKQWV
jgi:hypothetical protein